MNLSQGGNGEPSFVTFSACVEQDEASSTSLFHLHKKKFLEPNSAIFSSLSKPETVHLNFISINQLH